MAVWLAEALSEGSCGLVCLAGAAEGNVQWLAPRNLNKGGHRSPRPKVTTAIGKLSSRG